MAKWIWLFVIFLLEGCSKPDQNASSCLNGFVVSAGSLNDVEKNIGCNGSVEGIISRVHIAQSKQVIFLNLIDVRDYTKYDAGFSIVFFYKVNPAAMYIPKSGDVVQVHGKLSRYNDRVQMIVDSLYDIKIIRENDTSWGVYSRMDSVSFQQDYVLVRDTFDSNEKVLLQFYSNGKFDDLQKISTSMIQPMLLGARMEELSLWIGPYSKYIPLVVDSYIVALKRLKYVRSASDYDEFKKKAGMSLSDIIFINNFLRWYVHTSADRAKSPWYSIKNIQPPPDSFKPTHLKELSLFAGYEKGTFDAFLFGGIKQVDDW